MVTCEYTGNVCLGSDSSRLQFAPFMIERYSLGPPSVTVSLSSGQTLVMATMGYQNTDMSKENETTIFTMDVKITYKLMLVMVQITKNGIGTMSHETLLGNVISTECKCTPSWVQLRHSGG